MSKINEIFCNDHVVWNNRTTCYEPEDSKPPPHIRVMPSKVCKSYPDLHAKDHFRGITPSTCICRGFECQFQTLWHAHLSTLSLPCHYRSFTTDGAYSLSLKAHTWVTHICACFLCEEEVASHAGWVRVRERQRERRGVRAPESVCSRESNSMRLNNSSLDLTTT